MLADVLVLTPERLEKLDYLLVLLDLREEERRRRRKRERERERKKEDEEEKEEEIQSSKPIGFNL